MCKQQLLTQQGVTTIDTLASVACKSRSITPDCLDALLMAVLPASYSSNSSKDTGGYAFISPAQVCCYTYVCTRLDHSVC
jgi:hypothetical protein